MRERLNRWDRFWWRVDHVWALTWQSMVALGFAAIAAGFLEWGIRLLLQPPYPHRWLGVAFMWSMTYYLGFLAAMMGQCVYWTWQEKTPLPQRREWKY